MESTISRLQREEEEDSRVITTQTRNSLSVSLAEQEIGGGESDGGGDVETAADKALQQLEQRSQARSQHLAQEAERLLQLKGQVELRRKEAADRKLSILVKLTRRLDQNEAVHKRGVAGAGAGQKLGVPPAQTAAQRRQAERHEGAQQR